MVSGYGNGIGLGWYKKASVHGNGMHHALLNKLSSLKGLFQDVIEKIDYDTSGR